MQIAGRWRRSIKICIWIGTTRALVNAALDPDLGCAMILPISKDAYAITARKNIVEVMFELREGEIFIDHLGHLEGWLHLERDLCDHTQRAQSDYSAWKFVAQFFAGEGQDISTGDNLHRTNSG